MRHPHIHRCADARVGIERGGAQNNERTLGKFRVNVRPAARAEMPKFARTGLVGRQDIGSLRHPKIFSTYPGCRVALGGVRLPARLAMAVPETAIDCRHFILNTATVTTPFQHWTILQFLSAWAIPPKRGFSLEHSQRRALNVPPGARMVVISPKGARRRSDLMSDLRDTRIDRHHWYNDETDDSLLPRVIEAQPNQ
jgi:hypothetical protein